MKFIIILFSLLAGLTATAMAIGYWVERPVHLTTPVEIIVASGDGTREIAAKLDSAGLIHSRRAFRWLARWRNVDRHLRPGRYHFEGSQRLSDIVDQLHDGRAVVITVTIPEGWTIAKMARYLSGELGFSVDSFLALTRDEAIQRQWVPDAPSLEGYLWPESYQFYWGVAPREVLEELLRNARDHFSDSLARLPVLREWSRHRVLSLASMIEAEAADGNERDLISGVFHNRLREGWPLQCDPTVVYAMGGLPPGRGLQKSDLAFESPYNTYVHLGLPPGPICNPGLPAIRAALNPDATDAMYFVADGKGAHVFSQTLDQHNAARARVGRENH